MLNVTVDQMQQDPLKYLREVEAGETVVITRANKPIAFLLPPAENTEPKRTDSKLLRPSGLCAGEFTVPDDFDAPLPENLLDAFEGK